MSFNHEMLVLAREANGLLQSEFAALLKVSQATVSRWEAGLLEPTCEAQQDFGSHLGFADEFFHRSDRVYGFNSTVFFHRRQQSTTDRSLRKMHAKMNLLRMRVSSLLRSAQIQVPYRFESFDVGEYQGRIESIAQAVRSLWLMPPGHVRSVVRALEDAGAILHRMDFETKKVDAISEWIPGFPPIILLNSNLEIPPSRLRLTLAHELGHIVMHQLSLSQDIENDANRFAAEFMMPRKEIKASLFRLNLAKLMDLKREWKVSMAALVYQAHRLDTITPAQYKYLNINLRKRWGIHEPIEDEMPLEKPTILREMVNVHMAELGYTAGQMAKLLFYAQQPDFEREFLELGRMRLVG